MNEKISSRSTCPLCQSTGEGRVYRCTPSLWFRSCHACGIAFRSVPAEVTGLYDDTYSEHITTGFRSQGKVRHARGVLSQLNAVGKKGSLLDVGCADGAFLEEARTDGWTVTGVEMQERSAALARSRGLTVYTPSIEQLPEDVHVDAITLLDVIEHVAEPMAFLHRMFDTLNEDGVLYIETPNFGSVYRALRGGRWMGFIPFHDILYSEQAICSMLCDCGFSIINVTSDCFAPFSYDGLRRMRLHNRAFNLLAVIHAVLVRLGIRAPDSPISTSAGRLTRLINAPMDFVFNKALRRGDQLIITAAKSPRTNTVALTVGQ